VNELTADESKQFERKGFVVRKFVQSGRNCCGAFHSKKWVLDQLCKNLNFMDYVPGGARDANQDFFLMKCVKPKGSKNADNNCEFSTPIYNCD